MPIKKTPDSVRVDVARSREPSAPAKALSSFMHARAKRQQQRLAEVKRAKDEERA